MQDEALQKLRQKIRRRKPKKALTMDQVLAIQSAAIDASWEVLAMAQETGDTSEVLRATHAISQAASAFGKLVETKNYEQRIADLEASLAQRTATPQPRAYA